MTRPRSLALAGAVALLAFGGLWWAGRAPESGLLIDTGVQVDLPFLVTVARAGPARQGSSAQVIARQWVRSGSRTPLGVAATRDGRWELEVLHPTFVPLIAPLASDRSGNVAQALHPLPWSHRIANAGPVRSREVERHLAYVASKWLTEGMPSLADPERRRILLLLRRLAAIGICDAGASQASCRAIRAKASEHLEAIEAILDPRVADRPAGIQDAPQPSRRRPSPTDP